MSVDDIYIKRGLNISQRMNDSFAMNMQIWNITVSEHFLVFDHIKTNVWFVGFG